MDRVSSAPAGPPSRSTASKYFSNLDRSWPPSVSPKTSITASKCISEFTQSRPPDASLSSLDLGLQMHLQPHSIPTSKCISEFTRSRSPNSSRHSLDLGLLGHLSVHSISVSNHAQSRPPSTSLRNDGRYPEIQGYRRLTE